MSLLALALGVDVAFVAFHQILRLFIVQLGVVLKRTWLYY